MCVKFSYENYEFQCADFKPILPEYTQTKENLINDDNYLKFYGRVNSISSKTSPQTHIIHSKYYCLSRKSDQQSIKPQRTFSSKN